MIGSLTYTWTTHCLISSQYLSVLRQNLAREIPPPGELRQLPDRSGIESQGALAVLDLKTGLSLDELISGFRDAVSFDFKTGNRVILTWARNLSPH